MQYNLITPFTGLDGKTVSSVQLRTVMTVGDILAMRRASEDAVQRSFVLIARMVALDMREIESMDIRDVEAIDAALEKVRDPKSTAP